MISEAEFAIETTGLGKRFGSKHAVRDLNLQVPAGAVYGLLGLNGAGKSTTIRMLMGLLNPSDGEAKVLGLDPAADDIAVKTRVGYVADSPSFYEWMTVREILAFVAHHRPGRWNDKRAARLLADFGVSPDGRLRELSKGMRAKVSLVMALAFTPDLLLLDEPTGGLDPVARRQFYEGVLAEFTAEGRTVLVSSHLINEIAGLVDHVGILVDGRLVRSEPTESLLASVKRVRLWYEDAAPGGYACTGLVHARTDGREAQLLLDKYDAERAAAELKRLGAQRYEVEDLGLEELFIELVGRKEPVS